MWDEGSLYGVVEGFYGRPWTTEQRHDLFLRLREFGLNSYLYAPKDDEKHRAKWRELYTDFESNLLRSLIESATKAGILFIYALSPGVDIVYSDSREVQMVKEKLQQVQSLGCKSFALLYDDILQEMRPEDQDVFESFADAQVAITNNCFSYLGKPIFSFCPTEYRSRNASGSSYLKIVGEKLDPKIMIMWTGPAVVSRTITEEHLLEVTRVMKRKPLIWDNLHANDYDPKRVFMGPFSGRSVHIKKLISGVLLNPNCQYEANFLPIYTLGEWYRSEEDFDPELMNHRVSILKVVYEPDQSLSRGIAKWIHLFNGGIGPSIPPISQVESQVTTPVIDSGVVSATIPPFSIRTCEANELLPAALTELPPPLYTSPIGTATTVTVQAFPIDESIMNISDAHHVPQIVNSLSIEYSEPMDTNSLKEVEDEFMMTAAQMSPMDTTYNASPSTSTTPVDYEPTNTEINLFTPTLINVYEGKKAIKLLVDFFYLPFNSGSHGIKFLKDFQWLHEHANIMTKAMSTLEQDMLNVAQWRQKADGIISIVETITKFYLNLIDAPNRSLVQEIFPFVWDMQHILTILKAIVEWMQEGTLFNIPEEQGDWWDTSHLQEEPWCLGGGLLIDLQKLIVKNQDVCEFFSLKLATTPTATCYTLDTFFANAINQQEFYELFTEKAEKNIFLNEKAFFEQFLKMFDTSFTTTNHFQAKELNSYYDSKTVAYFLTISNLPAILQNSDFKNRLSSSLPTSLNDISQFIIPFNELPIDFIEKFPSFIDLRWRDGYQDPPVAVRRVLQSGVAALSLNGSIGCFTIIPGILSEKIDLFIRLGFQKSLINIPNFTVLVHRL